MNHSQTPSGVEHFPMSWTWPTKHCEPFSDAIRRWFYAIPKNEPSPYLCRIALQDNILRQHKRFSSGNGTWSCTKNDQRKLSDQFDR